MAGYIDLSELETLTISDLLAETEDTLSDIPDLVYGLNHKLDRATGHDPEDEADRYGDLTVEDYLARCRYYGLGVKRLQYALEVRAAYHSELADEAAYDRAHGYH